MPALPRSWHAACSAYVEAAVEQMDQQVKTDAAVHGLAGNWRFSPGYGDCPLSAQRSIVNALNATRLIGLTVTPTSLLMPTKSVTAVIGLFDGEVHDAQSRPTCNICQGTYEVVTFRGFQICRECFLGIREEVEKLG